MTRPPLAAAAALAVLVALGACAALATLGACGGRIPDTRYYRLAAPEPAPGAAPGASAPPAHGDILVVEPLSVEDALDDERIVYRSSPYRIDYYQYHRWSAAPGTLVADYLEQALERSGRFRAVLRERPDGASAVLGGRLRALEEVDESRARWVGRVDLELTLRDARTDAVLWTRELSETEPLAAQTPEGLARALSAAMGRIAARALPEIVAHMSGKQPALHSVHTGTKLLRSVASRQSSPGSLVARTESSDR